MTGEVVKCGGVWGSLIITFSNLAGLLGEVTHQDNDPLYLKGIGTYNTTYTILVSRELIFNLNIIIIVSRNQCNDDNSTAIVLLAVSFAVVFSWACELGPRRIMGAG